MFLAPLFLLGLLATAIPLVLHLRRSTRHKKIVFSTTRFFDEQFIRSSRRARLQDVLLMLLRMALLAFFVLALAQPIVGIKGLAALMGSKRNVAIVLDDSASMGIVDDQGPLLDRAKQGALAVIGDLSRTRGDRVTIVLSGRREEGPKVLFAEPTLDLEAAKRAVESVQLTDLATDLNAAIARAGELIGTHRTTGGAGGGATGGASGGGGAGGGVSTAGSKEIVVLSDMQTTAFAQGQAVDPGQGASVVFVASHARFDLSSENISVDAIQYGAPQPLQNVPFTFRALITNHAQRPRGATVSLVLDGQTVSQKTVELAAGRQQLVRFAHRFTKAGWFSGHIEVGPPPAEAPPAPTASSATTDDAQAGASASSATPPDAARKGDGPGLDAMSADNRRYFAVKVEDKVRLLAVNGAPSAVPLQDELFFLRLALTVNPESVNRLVAVSVATGGTSGGGSTSGGGGGGAVSGAVEVDAIPATEVKAERMRNYPLVLLANVANLEPESLQALEHFVDGGGNLFISLGDRIDPRVYRSWIGENRLHGGLLPATIGPAAHSLPGAAAGDPGASPGASPGPTTAPAPVLAPEPNDAGFIASVAEDHPITAGFGDGQMGSLTAVRFTSYFKLDASPEQVIIRSGNGDPLLVEKRFGRGRVLLWASTIDRDWNGFPLQSAYVPWLYRTVGYLAQGGLEGAGFVRTGQVVKLPTSATQAEALQVDGPDGQTLYPEAARVIATSPGAPGSAANVNVGSNSPPGMVVSNVEGSGVYRVRAAGTKQEQVARYLFAANLPSDESDPHTLDKAGLTPLIGASLQGNWDLVDAGGATIDSSTISRRGYGLWDALLILALLVGLFEPWVANRLSRRRGAVSPDAMSKRDVATPSRPKEAMAA